MKQLYVKILKFLLLIPFIPSLVLGFQQGLGWEGYLVIYVTSFVVLLAGVLLLRFLYFIFK